MIHIVTTNPISTDNIYDYADNFIICYMFQEPMLPLADKSLGYHFKIYHQDGMDLSDYEEYLDEPNFKYDFIPVPAITTALDEIIQEICNAEIDSELDAEEQDSSPDQLIFTICGSTIRLTSSICRYMNRKLKEEESEMSALNLYRHLQRTSIAQIAASLKMQLDTEMIYEDDPVAFSYVLNQFMNGVII